MSVSAVAVLCSVKPISINSKFLASVCRESCKSVQDGNVIQQLWSKQSQYHDNLHLEQNNISLKGTIINQ